MSQLNQQQKAELENNITSPPKQEPYDRLKPELVHQLSTSREQRVRQLLSHEEVGDRKPSQFLRRHKSLAPDVPDDFLRTIWASRLPPRVQAILVGHKEGYLDTAAHLADRICTVTSLPNTARISPSKPDNMAELLERIDELSRHVASLRASQTHSGPHSRDRQRSHSRDRRRSTTDNSLQPHDTYWYQWQFGNEARKCSPPCSHQQRDFRQQENSTGGR